MGVFCRGRGSLAIKWEYNGVCDGRCNRVCEGVGVIRTHDSFIEQPFPTAQMK